MIRVAVIDDQALVRMGLTTLIGSEPDLELVGEAADGRAGLALLRRTRPDVVLCDIRMPVLDGLGLLAEVAADPDLDHVRVVVLTTFELDEYVFEALRHGASGFLLKDAAPARLLDAIRVVAAGGSLLAPSVTRRVIEEFVRRAPNETPESDALSELTERELEVLRLVARGLSNAEIAEELVISPATAKTHVGRILMKLDLRDRVQAVVFAYETGLVRPATS